MPGKKGTDIALTYSYEGFDQYFFGNEKSEISNEVSSLNLFVEHGISDSFSIVANIPYLRADEFNKGLQDATLYAKYKSQFKRYKTGQLTQIIAAGITFPLSNYPTRISYPLSPF